MRTLWILMLALVLLTACGGDDENTSNNSNPATATRAVTLPVTWTPSPEGFVASPVPTDAPTQRPTREGGGILPPTWTPLPEGFVASPVPTEQRQSSAGTTGGSGGSLPPTWTPAPTSTVRPPEITIIPPTIFVFSGTIEPVDDLCFLVQPEPGVNAGSEVVQLGSQVLVFWSSIPLPEYTYRFRLIHPDGISVVLEQDVPETVFLIPENILTAENQVYSWEVQPLKNGSPTCFPITDEIYVQAFN